MKEKILVLIVAFSFWNSFFAQNTSVELKTYDSFERNYSIKYPKDWKIEKNKDGVVSIESDKIKGGIYISGYSGITFSDEYMTDFILESNSLSTDFKKNIRIKEEKGIKSWYISYTDTKNNLVCISAYKRLGENLWFVSTEMDPKLWKKGWKEIIVEIIVSFEIK